MSADNAARPLTDDEREYNVCIANGLVGKARVIERRIRAASADQTRDDRG